MNLRDALWLGEKLCAAFVGAGGKSAALFQLARQFQPPVLLSSSTHLGADQIKAADAHFVLIGPEDLRQIIIDPEKVTIFTGPVGENDRTRGLPDEILNVLYEQAAQIKAPFLMEADGSRRRPLKAPADHEPAIPRMADIVVVVAGLSGLEKRLGKEIVHRPERFAALSGLQLGEMITSDALAKVLTHPDGGLKNIENHCQKIALLNQADTPEFAARGKALANKLLAGGYDSVVVAALEPSDGRESEIISVHQRVGAVILAAGASLRFGQPKQLLDWEGEPFIRRVTRTALDAGCGPVVVVTGALTEGIDTALQGLPVRIVHNPDWADGQSTSVKVGLNAIKDEVGSVLFFLVDQPQIPVNLVKLLIEQHASSLDAIIAPMINDRRSNPVLFDNVTFNDFSMLKGDQGGRQLFSRFKVSYLPWLDDRAALDVDTPEDYQRLISGE